MMFYYKFTKRYEGIIDNKVINTMRMEELPAIEEGSYFKSEGTYSTNYYDSSGKIDLIDNCGNIKETLLWDYSDDSEYDSLIKTGILKKITKEEYEKMNNERRVTVDGNENGKITSGLNVKPKKKHGYIKNGFMEMGYLHGNLYGDEAKRWKDGTFVNTSKIVRVSVDENGNLQVETQNSIYTLMDNSIDIN